VVVVPPGEDNGRASEDNFGVYPRLGSVITYESLEATWGLVTRAEKSDVWLHQDCPGCSIMNVIPSKVIISFGGPVSFYTVSFHVWNQIVHPLPYQIDHHVL